MCELTHVLTVHAGRYPEMRPQDAVKLIYQNEFGGGHMISDPGANLIRLREEHAAIAPDPAAPLTEDIGNGMARVMLAALRPEEYPLDALNDGFVRSAARCAGDPECFQQKLDVLRRVTGQGLFAFSAAELEEYLAHYRAAGCPAVSHSERYRAAYRPAYRVLKSTFVLPSAAIGHAVGQLPAPASRPLLVAIDGRCASGKSTLGEQLHRQHGWPVIHMDDFFLRPEQRTQARYAVPGENIDHERFEAEVLRPLHRDGCAAYRPFDCGAMALGALVAVPAAPVVLVEGSYACHPALRPYYDLRVFLTVPPQEQLRRIRARNGEYARVFQEKWIPLEESYFSACRVAEQCELHLET